MKVSKVEFGNDTVMDITDSTVTENNLLSGEIAYGSDGERVVGTVTVPTDLDDLSDVTITSPTDGQALVYDNGNWVNGDVATTDEKVKVENTPVHSATSFTRRITLAPDNDNTEITSLEKTSALRYEESNTGSSSGISAFCLGGTNYTGGIQLYRGGGTSFHAEIHPSDLTATRSVSLPDKNGTIALTNDINNNTITIKENGSTVDTFTLNQSSDKAIDIPVNQSYYGTCTDNGDVAAKTVTISNQNFKLAVGAVVSVKYTNSNTASSVTLNVNGSGNKSVWYNNAVYTSTSANVLGTANRITTYIYDGTYWVWYGHGTIVDSNTHRPINVNGTQLLGNNTTAVNFKNGTNTTVVGSGADIQINATNTDRYVNSASFADDTTNSANSPVKMTLTRAGSDTNTVTANIPKVSSTSAGVAPKGAAVSSQSQTTKFLREDGSWSAPSYTSIPSNNVTGSGTNGYLTKFNGANTITNGPKLGSDTTKFLRNDGSWEVPTGTTYTGTGLISINSSNEISTTAEKNQNAFSTVGIKVGSTTTNLAAETTTDTLTIVQGSNITLTPTANTDTFKIAATDTTYTGDGLISVNASTHVISTTATANTGTVTKVSTGAGLTGGDIETTGTIKCALKSETKSTLATASRGSTTSREYPVGLDKNGVLSVNIPWTDRYVNSASFADDTSSSANSPVKMTLTRAGSDTSTVTANLPKVSKDSAGVAPKGAAVSSFSTSTKFLREDGAWYAPKYNTLALGTAATQAYYGDKGNTAYSHATDSSRLTTAQSEGLYKIATTTEGHIASVTAVAKADITALGIPGSDTNTVACAYCNTAAGTAAKTATCTDYALLNKSWLIVTIKNSNTSKTALTLNINEKGAKSIYINGNASSSSNYTLNAGTYFVYYESNIYYFRNDGKISLNAGGFVNTSLYIKNPTVDMTKTGNNLSSTLYTDYHFVDNNNKIGASVRPIYYYNATTGAGDVGLDLIARNWSVPAEGGTSVQMASGGFRIVAAKNGNLNALLDNTHTATGVKNIIFTIGNDKANGTTSSNDGVLRLYGKNKYYGQFYDANNKLTNNRTYQLPDANGIMALTNNYTGNALKWQGSVTLNTSTAKKICDNASDYNEVKILAIGSDIALPLIVSVSDIPDSQASNPTQFRTGYYQNGTYGGELAVTLYITDNTLYGLLNLFWINGSQPSGSTITAQYR